jgi:ketosteroid isomerase-like protein
VTVSKATQGETPGQVVSRVMGALAAFDIETMLANLTEDIEVHEPASLPYGGVFRGRQAFVEQLVPAIATNFDIEVGDVRVFEGDGRAAAQFEITFTGKRSGTRLTMPYVEVHTVRDGLVARIDVYPQDAAALAELFRIEAG